jgi:hypothetical protein
MDSLPKVVGYIMLPDAPKKHKCTCDDCGWEVPDGWGDPRVKIETYNSKDAIEPIAVRMICEWCADELFRDSEPHSIFDGTPDWMMMI